jgi:hypothetical protein
MSEFWVSPKVDAALLCTANGMCAIGTFVAAVYAGVYPKGSTINAAVTVGIWTLVTACNGILCQWFARAFYENY